jgi:hypothetical protein
VFDKTLKALIYGGDVLLDLAQMNFAAQLAPETRVVHAQLKKDQSFTLTLNTWSFGPSQRKLAVP